MGPLAIDLWICGGITLAVWLASVITREYSWTDRIWSLAPIAYVWVFAARSGMQARLVLMAVLVTAWGLRLTFNFARKGGYRPGGEDYRWAHLRAKLPGWGYQLFNLLFIAIYQNALILLMTLPALTVYLNPGPVGGWDFVVAGLFLAALGGETIADQQQWDFHHAKARAKKQGLELDPPFLTTGLFAFSRHPNYFFEQAQWWIFYGFAIAATGQVFHWTVGGALLVSVLFVGSTVFTESISKAKYPAYADYQARVSAIIPLPARRRTAPAPAN